MTSAIMKWKLANILITVNIWPENRYPWLHQCCRRNLTCRIRTVGAHRKDLLSWRPVGP